MPTTDSPLHSDLPLGQLASSHPGASRVFHRHGLDFCCGGSTSLADACSAANLDLPDVLAELRTEFAGAPPGPPWTERPIPELIDHLLEQFHEPHRREVPRLLAMARKVEEVHAAKEACPRGLADHVERMGQELELHMQKEEQILFPLLRAGRGSMAGAPIQVMQHEHREHGANLERLRELTHGFTPPADACGTWNALYLGLSGLERDLMEHIHLENNVLFPKALH